MIDVPRRAVLGAGLGAIGLAVIGVDAPDASAAASSLPRRSHYLNSVGRTFVATSGRYKHKVRLARIHNVAGGPAKRRDESFNLVFVVARGRQLADGTYTITRKGVRTHRLFLSRLGDGASMQAVVNRSV
jgi:hypothetical protein